MKTAALSPRRHLFVCVNQRPSGDPLGEGCGARGLALYDALKTRVAHERAYAQVWVTKTHCLGLCPRRGATLACYPEGGLHDEVMADDLERVWQLAQGSRR